MNEPPTRGQPSKRGQKLCSQSVLHSEVPLYSRGIIIHFNVYSFYTSTLSQIDGLPQQPAVNAYPTQFLDTEDSLISDELEDHTEVCGWEGVVIRPINRTCTSITVCVSVLLLQCTRQCTLYALVHLQYKCCALHNVLQRLLFLQMLASLSHSLGRIPTERKHCPLLV